MLRLLLCLAFYPKNLNLSGRQTLIMLWGLCTPQVLLILSLLYVG